jgi:hypothetical protein
MKQPTWLTLTEYWWSKSLRKLGLARRAAPVIAVSATASCGLPWDELSSQRFRVPWLTAPDGRHVDKTVPNRDFVPRFGSPAVATWRLSTLFHFVHRYKRIAVLKQLA